MISKKGVVVSILDQKGNQIPKRSKEGISIPFYTEYQVKIRNTNNRSIVVDMFLEGVRISEDRFFIPAGRAVIVNRFHASEGGSFKFVESIEPEVEKNERDRDQSIKGNLVVKFWLEKEDAFGYFDHGGIDKINEYHYLFTNGELKPEKVIKVGYVGHGSGNSGQSGYSGVSGYSGIRGMTINDSIAYFEIFNEQIEEIEEESNEISIAISPFNIDQDFRIPRIKTCGICNVDNGRWAKYCMACGSILINGGYENE